MIIFNSALRKAKGSINKYSLNPEEYELLKKAIVNENCLALFYDEEGYNKAIISFLELYNYLKNRVPLLKNRFFIFTIMQKYAQIINNIKLRDINVSTIIVSKIMTEYTLSPDRKNAENMYIFILKMATFFDENLYKRFVDDGIFSNKPQDYYQKLYKLICQDFETIPPKMMLEIILKLLCVGYYTKEDEEMTLAEKDELYSHYFMLKKILNKNDTDSLQSLAAGQHDSCKIINFPQKKGN